MSSFPFKLLRGTSLGTMALLLASCAVGPDFVRPSPPDADRYTRKTLPAVTLAADGKTQRFMPDAVIPSDWWKLFRSPPLDATVEQALAHNATLEASEASLRQSQDNLRAGYGVFFPHAEGDFGATRERSSPAQQGSQGAGSIFNLITLSGTVSYAPDVFGGERRTVEGLQAKADYQRYETKAAYLTLSANVVNTCIARAAYAAEIRETEQLIELEKQQLHAIEVQVHAGIASYSGLLSQRSLIAGHQASLAPLKQQVSQAEHLLATLEGVLPEKVILPEIDLATLFLPPDLPVSLPSDLVRQRPDILSSEAQLHAASAGIGVATAAMFPSFSLSGTFGAAGSSFGKLSPFWSIGPSATIPVFQGTSLWYGRRAAIDLYQQSQATYRQTVLAAFAQVADSLDALEHDAEALRAQTDSRRDAAEALDLLQINYRTGLASGLDVLAGDVQFHEATLSYLQAVAQRHQDTVALYVALGGGWWNPVIAEEKEAIQ